MKVKGRFRLAAPARRRQGQDDRRAPRRPLTGVTETPATAGTVLRGPETAPGPASAPTSSISACSSSWPAASPAGSAGAARRSALLEGQTADVPQAAFRVRLDKFETEYYPQGGVKDWKSTVTVVENGAPVLTRVVEVNHPLTYRGVSFYQTSYGWDWQSVRRSTLEVRKRADASFSKIVTRSSSASAAAVDDADDRPGSPSASSSPISSSAKGTRSRAAPRSRATRPPSSRPGKRRSRSSPAGSSPGTPTSARATPRASRRSPSSSSATRPPRSPSSRRPRTRE
ncbi:MAG: cytochrome c biogenesis protein ResB [Candidatus Moduliflexus flocculans]|nr:cytochrome c biogenesis protein ResB [Candidatus Moduliflexus flocculans]